MTRVLGEPLTPQERARLVAAARAQVGVRFRHMGRSGRGVDCAGTIKVALLALGRGINDNNGESYGRVPHNDTLRKMLVLNLGEPLPPEAMQIGDVPLMVFENEPHHVGLLGDYPYGGLSLIHAYQPWRRVVEHRLDEVWRKRIIEVYRP
jgi:cell wall-associated NlpC family hydrolase